MCPNASRIDDRIVGTIFVIVVGPIFRPHLVREYRKLWFLRPLSRKIAKGLFAHTCVTDERLLLSPLPQSPALWGRSDLVDRRLRPPRVDKEDELPPTETFIVPRDHYEVF